MISCDLCHEPMGEDETGMMDTDEKVGGHLSCMYDFFRAKESD